MLYKGLKLNIRTKKINFNSILFIEILSRTKRTIKFGGPRFQFLSVSLIGKKTQVNYRPDNGRTDHVACTIIMIRKIRKVNKPILNKKHIWMIGLQTNGLYDHCYMESSPEFSHLSWIAVREVLLKATTILLSRTVNYRLCIRKNKLDYFIFISQKYSNRLMNALHGPRFPPPLNKSGWLVGKGLYFF